MLIVSLMILVVIRMPDVFVGSVSVRRDIWNIEENVIPPEQI